MGIFNNNKNTGSFSFTTPYTALNGQDLSQPYISDIFQGTNGYVRYGSDNKYPNTLRQLTHKSPLVGSIIDYLVNATIGGGIEMKMKDTASGPNRVNAHKFHSLLTKDGLLNKLCLDAIRFECINIIITNDKDGNPTKVQRVPMDEIRWEKNMKAFYYSKDFHRGTVERIEAYNQSLKNHRGVLSIRLDDGDQPYPVPKWAAAGNWAFLDGESSFLHKANIENSIFPSVIFKFPKKPQNDAEMETYKKTITSAKGAAVAGKAIAFFENGADQLPEIVQLQAGGNDKLFLQTDERMDTKICQAFTLDPILMGIRVSGKLGSGADIKQSYIILEKNKIRPLREVMNKLMERLALMFGVNAEYKVVNYQIINEEIEVVIENEAQKTINSLNAMSPLVATKVLETLTKDEVRALAGLGPAIEEPTTIL